VKDGVVWKNLQTMKKQGVQLEKQKKLIDLKLLKIVHIYLS